MSLRAAVNLMNTIALPGTWKKYDADSVPAQISQATLPAVILVESSNESGDMTEATFGGQQYDVTYHVGHLLVWKPLVSGRINKIVALGNLVDFLDTYLAAAKLIIPLFPIMPTITIRRLPNIVDGEGDFYAREFVWHLPDFLDS